LYPLGYGREVYFWSFMVAMLLFSGGGVFSIYEGVHRILEPEPIEHVSVGVAILGFSLLLEGGSALSNIKELNKRRGDVPFFRFLRETKDSDLIVVFGENAAASLGLTFAIGTTVLASVTGDGRWDGAGSFLVGLVLVGVSVFLAREVKSLLVGEAADPSVRDAVEAAATAHPKIGEVLRVITIQQGPGEIMVAAKVRLEGDLTGQEVVIAINEFERDLRRRCPEVRWSFIEPDDEA
jgi:divalent metal cation (Fe/Co/Zn/Cd) transporter